MVGRPAALDGQQLPASIWEVSCPQARARPFVALQEMLSGASIFKANDFSKKMCIWLAYPQDAP